MLKKKNKVTQSLTTPPREGIVIPDFDPKDLQRMIHLLNARPETDIKVFRDRKQIELTDIGDLDQKIKEKLSLMETTNANISIDILFHDKRAKKFNSWTDFSKIDWNISQKIKTVNITWDFYIKLPNYKFPQGHTLKIRLGARPRPAEIFHILIEDGDESDINEIMSSAVCRVDFVDPLISDELINIVSKWYESLPLVHKKNSIEKYLITHSKELADFVSYLFPIFTLVIAYSIVNNFLQIPHVVDLSKLLRQTAFWIMLFTAFLILSFYTGKILAHHKVERKLEELNFYSMFNITKGDKKTNKDIKNKNHKLLKDLCIQLTSLALISILGYFIPLILKIFIIK